MTKKEWNETVKEIEVCRAALKKHFGNEYVVNAIERLIMARIKLERINALENIVKEGKTQ